MGYLSDWQEAETAALAAHEAEGVRMDTVTERVWRRIEASMPAPDGRASLATWECEDGWTVQYTTSRVEGGPADGKFAVLVFRPVGKGSRSGKATTLKRVTFTRCATRRRAREVAERHYYRHSPKAAARHGRPPHGGGG